KSTCRFRREPVSVLQLGCVVASGARFSRREVTNRLPQSTVMLALLRGAGCESIDAAAHRTKPGKVSTASTSKKDGPHEGAAPCKESGEGHRKLERHQVLLLSATRASVLDGGHSEGRTGWQPMIGTTFPRRSETSPCPSS